MFRLFTKRLVDLIPLVRVGAERFQALFTLHRVKPAVADSPPCALNRNVLAGRPRDNLNHESVARQNVPHRSRYRIDTEMVSVVRNANCAVVIPMLLGILPQHVDIVRDVYQTVLVRPYEVSPWAVKLIESQRRSVVPAKIKRNMNGLAAQKRNSSDLPVFPDVA